MDRANKHALALMRSLIESGISFELVYEPQQIVITVLHTTGENSMLTPVATESEYSLSLTQIHPTIMVVDIEQIWKFKNEET